MSVKEGKNNKFTSNSSDAREFGTPVYILQPYPFNNHIFSLMFDTGCQNFVCRSEAVNLLPDANKENTMPGPIIVSGVGCKTVTSEYGQYSVKLPTYNGQLVTFNGICLDVITGVMPNYPVKEARKSIVAEYIAKGGKESDLPDVPLLVGGETDFLIGLQYNYYQPRLVFMLPTGLAIYESLFVGVDNTRGCIGGPHEVFRQCERHFLETGNIAKFKVFLKRQIQLFNSGIRVCLDCDSLLVNHADSCSSRCDVAVVTDDDRSSDSKSLMLDISIADEA